MRDFLDFEKPLKELEPRNNSWRFVSWPSATGIEPLNELEARYK